jgi:small-conductance mechanosensitive channel
VIVAVAFLVNRLLKSLTGRLVRATDSDTLGRVARMREQQSRTIAGVLYSAGTAIIVVVAALTALPEFGFNITPVAAAAGLASLAVGFGAQHLVRDFINGFFTVFEDQYVVVDIIRVGAMQTAPWSAYPTATSARSPTSAGTGDNSSSIPWCRAANR